MGPNYCPRGASGWKITDENTFGLGREMGKLNSREIDAPFDISRLTACNGLRITKSNEGTFY